jgi:hypothetical protein
MFCNIKTDDPPEIVEAIAQLPSDVQKVVADFKNDYVKAVNNFKESYLAAFLWASEACNQLVLLRSYLEAEQMRGEVGLVTDHQQSSQSAGPHGGKEEG